MPLIGRIRSRVMALLCLIMLLAAGLTPFLGLARNRLLGPKPVLLFDLAPSLPLWLLILGWVLLAASALTRKLRLPLMPVAAAGLILLADLWLAGSSARDLLAAAASPAARVSLGAAFWVILLAASLGMGEALRQSMWPLMRQALALTPIIAGILVLASAGLFDDLSIVREWAGRREAYAAAIGEHLLLVGAALLLTLPIGTALGAVAVARPASAKPIFTVLNLIQTIPSIALFGLLIGPLTALSEAIPGLREIGIRGIGFTPALIALVLYALLPMARAVHAGFSTVPTGTLEAARGMGFNQRQLLTDVTVPLSMPSLIAGLRIVTIQMIGLTIVAALIGAGGLGTFVFQGLGQTATDLVLLGALTAILLALLVDVLLRALGLWLRPGRSG